MSSIVIQGDTSGSITVEAPSVAGTHTLTLPKATGNIATDATVGLGIKNRIINGNMVIDQRNAGASVTVTSTSSATYTIDRYQAFGTQASKFSVQQNAGSVTLPTGYTNYAGITSLSAYAVTPTDRFQFGQAIEGFNAADLAWGTASASSVTLSFWVRSSLTGTFGGSLGNNAGNRNYPFTYTISSANTWEKKTVTIPGDTTGTWLTNNGVGLYVLFGLGAGSTLSGTAGAWTSSFVVTATGATSVVGTSGATWYLTGVQLEVGENATPFENRMYGTELALCKRYCHVLESTAVTGRQTICSACSHTTTDGVGFLQLPVEMRVIPSLSVSAVGDWAVHMPGINRSQLTALGIGANGDQKSLYITYAHASNVAYGSMKYVFIDTWASGTGKFILSAEL